MLSRSEFARAVRPAARILRTRRGSPPRRSSTRRRRGGSLRPGMAGRQLSTERGVLSCGTVKSSQDALSACQHAALTCLSPTSRRCGGTPSPPARSVPRSCRRSLRRSTSRSGKSARSSSRWCSSGMRCFTAGGHGAHPAREPRALQHAAPPARAALRGRCQRRRRVGNGRRRR